MKKNIRAKITLLTNVPHPKVAGVISGCAPIHKFGTFPELVSGFHDYGDTILHYPGEVLEADIGFPSWDFVGHLVSAGDSFELYEGNKLIGQGVVLQVCGPDA